MSEPTTCQHCGEPITWHESPPWTEGGGGLWLHDNGIAWCRLFYAEPEEDA